jgi:hypothetical protein
VVLAIDTALKDRGTGRRVARSQGEATGGEAARAARLRGPQRDSRSDGSASRLYFSSRSSNVRARIGLEI